MYLNFYQLCKKPFSLAPDPEFLYLSQQHKDALGAIIYGIKAREGFVSVVGEVGTGKTTVIRSYLNSTSRNQILPIFIFNSDITFSELMKVFLNEVGLNAEVIQRLRTVNDMVRVAYQSMLEKTSQGKNIVVIIDEAQNMPVETLKNLCVLSNFETAKAKLIQIVLVGQPELQKKLDLYELRQLRQRVAYRAKITPLSAMESIKYINHRLTLATKGQQKPVFAASATKQIIKHAKGVPRVINILCENALVAGYGLQKRPVTLKIVKEVIAEYEGKRFPDRFWLKKVTSSILGLLMVSLLVVSYLPSSLQPSEKSTEEVLFPTHSPGASSEPATLIVSEQETLQPKPESIPALIAERDLSSQRSVRSRTVKKGDTVSMLLLETYGFYSTRTLEWLKNYNPHIANMDEIQVDQVVYFPEIEP